jgi:hypothetical protein
LKSLQGLPLVTFTRQEAELGAVRVTTALWRIYGGKDWLLPLIDACGRCGDFAKAVEGLEVVMEMEMEDMPMVDWIGYFIWSITNGLSRSVRPVGLQCVTWLVKEKGLPLNGLVLVMPGGYRLRLLQCAVSTGSAELVQHLLNLGADVNAVHLTGGYGRLTALSLATNIAGDEESAVLKLLLRAGADPNLEASLGKNTALVCALTRERWAKARLLVEHGARLEPSDHCEWGERSLLHAFHRLMRSYPRSGHPPRSHQYGKVGACADTCVGIWCGPGSDDGR